MGLGGGGGNSVLLFKMEASSSSQGCPSRLDKSSSDAVMMVTMLCAKLDFV